jgi:GH25 family lysozyme M1 (1,4-beta-N-acetylmuramidase)
MTYTHGIDISAYQHQRGIDGEKRGESKYRVLVCKLSEGMGGSQLELCLEHGEQARRRGWDFSVYHFADKPLRYPAQREAAVFLRLFKQVRHLCSFAPVLDIEPRGTGESWGERRLTRDQVAQWAREWAGSVGVVPIIYTPAGRSYVDKLVKVMAASPRWLSTRPWRIKAEDRDDPPSEPAWQSAPEGADLWQYASRCGGVPGIPGSCDRNLVRDVCRLRQHWSAQ